MELEPSSTPFVPVDDKRRRIEEPLAVMLMAVADCVLRGWAGIEKKLDEFYVGLLGFERESADEGIVYRAENFRLRFKMSEKPEEREDFLALGVTVGSLAGVMQKLDEMEKPYMRQQKLTVGVETILIYDPARNLIEVGQTQRVF